MVKKDWLLRTDDNTILRFRSLYECIDYAESNNLKNCEVIGPALTTKENRAQLDTVKQYITEDCGQVVH
jgi:hypothetical protein